MSQKPGLVSLIPYLQSPTASIELPLRSDDPKQLEGMLDPFVIVDDSSRLGRLIDASFVTDAGASLKRLSLFIQRSQYSFVPDPLRPLNNKAVESIWQAAYGVFLQNSKDSGLIQLSILDDGNGHLNAVAPVFLCKRKRVYFEPPCPMCGSALTQCEDDDALASSGLPVFSTSLQRFLHCENCLISGVQPLFYAYDKEGMESEKVKDRFELIKSYSNLLEASPNEIALPCLGCDEKDICFGSPQKATSRIAVLSFYPFYMIPFEALCLHCVDFLALLSGAKAQDVAANLHPAHRRAARLLDVEQYAEKGLPFFFDQGERFLEIFYLKLTFLRQLALWLTKLPLGAEQDFGSFSMDSFWVDLPRPREALPYFWGFELKPHGLYVCQPERTAPISQSIIDPKNFFALAWFFVMLRNSTQDMQAILENIAGLFKEGVPVSTDEFVSRVESSQATGFEPANLYWEPQEAQISEAHLPLWISCLRLGWDILRASYGGPCTSTEICTWVEQIETLQKEVKQVMFTSPKFSHKPVATVQEQAPEVDKKIAAILREIAARWESELVPESSSSQEVPPASKQNGIDKPLEAPGQEESQPALGETIIITPGPKGLYPDEIPQVSEQEQPEEEEIPETIIFSSPAVLGKSEWMDTAAPPGAHKDKGGASSPTEEDKEFEKTLSMLDQELGDLVGNSTAEPPQGQGSHEQATDQEPAKETGMEDDIPETVIIKPKDE